MNTTTTQETTMNASYTTGARVIQGTNAYVAVATSARDEFTCHHRHATQDSARHCLDLARQVAKLEVAEMATRVKVGTMRNMLMFQTLFQAEQAAAILTRAGITCTFEGRNQPILHTAADFAPKG